MKKLFAISIVITLIISIFSCGELTHVSFSQSKNSVYVGKLKSEVNPGMYYYVKNTIKKAEEKKADVIVFEIDTFGGRVDSAVKISDMITSSSIPTIAYINTKAESAGVLLSIACDKIYMAEGATIGSAETIPNTEKNISYWTSQLKSVAEQKGRNPEIVAAMADKDIQIEGLIHKGKLLNLTSKKAKEIKFIDGIAKSRKEIYEDLKINLAKENVLEDSLFESFINLITSSYIAPLLLSLGFVGMIIELLTPGFGVGGIISIFGFSLFFGGSILGGSATAFVLLVFLLGIISLIIEALAPGFGIFGMVGMACVAFSIIMVSNSVLQAFLYILIAFVVTIGATVFAFKKLPKRKIGKTLFLDTKLDKKEGFISSKENYSYLEKEGITVSYLRPSGKIEIEGEILDATSESTFIEKGKKIKVIKVEGSKIIVRKQKEE